MLHEPALRTAHLKFSIAVIRDRDSVKCIKNIGLIFKIFVMIFSLLITAVKFRKRLRMGFARHFV